MKFILNILISTRSSITSSSLRSQSTLSKPIKPIHVFQTEAYHSTSDLQSRTNTSSIQPLKKVTLERLIKFGHPPLSNQELIRSAELTRFELCERLQRRVNAHLSLPYLPASNPHTKRVMSIYSRSLEDIKSLSSIKSIEDNDRFVKILKTMLDDATDVIGLFATGFKESKRYLSEEQINTFLDLAIKSRISMRLIGEQHLSLSIKSDNNNHNNNSNNNHNNHLNQSHLIGIVNTQLNIKQSVENSLRFVNDLCEATYGIAPDWIIECESDLKVCFIGMHLEYVLIEILKNAFRATVEHHQIINRGSNQKIELPSIEIKISFQTQNIVNHSIQTSSNASTLNQSEQYQIKNFNKSNEDDINQQQEELQEEEEELRERVGNSKNRRRQKKLVCLRIRDFGGGIPLNYLNQIFNYDFTTVNDHHQQQHQNNDDVSSNNYNDLNDQFNKFESLNCNLGRIAGLGYGLPMARLYCRYFNGNLEIVSINGLGGGTDCYITLGVLET